MAGLAETTFESWLSWLLGGVLAFFGKVAVAIGDVGLLQTQLPWVQTLYHTLFAVAAALFGVYLAYLALTRWILWNEGTADYDGTVLFKGVLRTTLYLGLSGTLSLAVFRFGIDLMGVVMSTSLVSGVHSLRTVFASVVGIGGGLAMVVVGLIAVCLAVVALAWIFLEMLERSAEIVYYFLAAPFVALGQLNADGGAWASWWKNLVILSISNAVQLVAIVGMAGTTQLIGSLQTKMGVGLGGGGLGAVLALLFDVGWLLAGVRGPHVLKDWSYRSGMAGVGGWVSGQASHHGATAVMGGGRKS